MIEKYRNNHVGRAAVLLLSGPTLAQYVEPEPDLITCGVNTVMFHHPDLDYFFLQDVGTPKHADSYVNRKAGYDAFKPRIAKFYGVTLCKQLQGQGGAIPYEFTHAPIIDIGGARIEDPNVPADFSADLAVKLPAAAGSIAFPALQFLLYTGVARIYIVGADIIDGRRIGEEKPAQNYARQNHLGRWLEFERWVAATYPHVEIIPLNPVGLKDMFALRKDTVAAEPASTPHVGEARREQLRFHCLGVPHTITSPEFAHCAYTQKLRRFCKFMTERGHVVYHYGHTRSEVVCTEHISITDDDTIKQYADWQNTVYNGELGDHCNKVFTERALEEVTKRTQLRDFLLCWYGVGHKHVGEQLDSSMIVVEPGIGTFNAFAPFRVYESYATMHVHYGKYDQSPKWYDAVIPSFIDPADYTFSAKKEDWLLYLGRVQQLKGINAAIKIAQRTGRRLKVAGQGTIDDVPPHVDMLGYADQRMKADLLSRAAALVQPSLYLEPFGNNVIEASISGTPVITPDWGAFTETVVHGVTGWRCRNMDQFDWAVRNIEKIKPETCRQWALNNYTIDQARERYEEYFKQLRGVFFGCDFNGSDPSRVAIVGPTRHFARVEDRG